MTNKRLEDIQYELHCGEPVNPDDAQALINEVLKLRKLRDDLTEELLRLRNANRG